MYRPSVALMHVDSHTKRCMGSPPPHTLSLVQQIIELYMTCKVAHLVLFVSCVFKYNLQIHTSHQVTHSLMVMCSFVWRATNTYEGCISYISVGCVVGSEVQLLVPPDELAETWCKVLNTSTPASSSNCRSSFHWSRESQHSPHSRFNKLELSKNCDEAKNETYKPDGKLSLYSTLLTWLWLFSKTTKRSLRLSAIPVWADGHYTCSHFISMRRGESLLMCSLSTVSSGYYLHLMFLK